MGKEIERKFLLKDDSWRSLACGKIYHQGYLSITKERVVRVRVIGEKGFLTIKRFISGMLRMEFEYAIPIEDAREMLDEVCEKPLIEKKRYRIEHQGMVWEIDEFLGANEGLVVAEVELEQENQSIEKPEWIGAEVTEDPRYLNINLVRHPFSKW
jgi:CYTH domain-containing protein